MVYLKPKDRGVCSVPFLKYILYLYNFLFLFLSAGAVVGFGVWTILYKQEYISLLASSTYPAIAYLLVTSGILVAIVAIIGCFGVLRENRAILLLYIFLLLLGLLLSSIAGLLAYIYGDQARLDMSSSLNETMMTEYGFDEKLTESVDDLQRSLRCCGAARFEDWRFSAWKRSDVNLRNLVPDSCCRTESPGCGVRDHPSNIYYDDCSEAYQYSVEEHLVILRAVGFGFCLIQFLGVLVSCSLYVKLRDYYYNY